MLKELIAQLRLDLGNPSSIKEEGEATYFHVDPLLKVSFKELHPGVLLTAPLGPCPKAKREELLIYLMRANFLGQGTGGKASISLDGDEKFLTLSLSIPYDINYRDFKETLEEFCNYSHYWIEELSRLVAQADSSIIT